jgi:hypothetical protein
MRVVELGVRTDLLSKALYSSHMGTADPEGRLPTESYRKIREIVEKVVIQPRGRHKAVEIEIYGQLAALLRI